MLKSSFIFMTTEVPEITYIHIRLERGALKKRSWKEGHWIKKG